MDIILLFILIGGNGVLALAEIAVISANLNLIRTESAKGNPQAIIVEQFKMQPQKFLSSIQVGITLVGILAGAIGGVKLADHLVPTFEWMGLSNSWAFSLSVGFVIVMITYLNILFGELIPKTIALQQPEKMALKLSRFVYYFASIFSPVVYLLTRSTQIVTKLLGIDDVASDTISEDEIRSLIKLANKQGVLENKETELLQNIFRFANRYAQQIMTPVREISWLDTSDLKSARKIIQSSPHTKFIVADGDINQIVGYLNIRKMMNDELPADYDIREYISTPVYLEKGDNATVILEKFSTARCYFGIVLDYKKRVLGIVTLHDLIEGIFGDLPLKHEIIEPPITVRDNGSLLVSGHVLLDEIIEKLPGTYTFNDAVRFETVANLLLDIYPDIRPHIGQVFELESLRIEIIDVDGVEIDKVLVTKKSA